LSASSDDLSAILIAVRNDVMKETQNKQVPWEHSALTGRFYFKGAPQAAAPSAPAAPQPQGAATPPRSQSDEAERAWSSAKDTTSIAVLEAFIARFKDSFYAELARARIEELKKQQVAVAPPARSQPPPQAPTSPAALPPGDKFGAIAYSPSTTAHGWAFDFGSQSEAEAAALTNCRQHASDCIIPIWFRNACGALAVGPSGYGSGWGVDRGTAEGYAMQTCRKYSKNCGIRRWVCTTR
jgi:serine/threonine-protein kinase